MNHCHCSDFLMLPSFLLVMANKKKSLKISLILLLDIGKANIDHNAYLLSSLYINLKPFSNLKTPPIVFLNKRIRQTPRSQRQNLQRRAS